MGKLYDDYLVKKPRPGLWHNLPMQKWAVGLLLATAALWGSSFVVTKVVVTSFDPYDFLMWRFAVASVVLLLVCPKVWRLPLRLWAVGGVLGVFEAFGTLAQTVGLVTVSASVSGFISGLYVVGTPLLTAVLFRRHIGRYTWIAVAVSTVGLAVLTVSFDQGLPTMGTGEMLTLAGAVCYSIHISLLSRVSTVDTAISLTLVQTLTMAVIYLVWALPGGLTVPDSDSQWGAILYLGVVVGAITIGTQTWAQAHLSAPTSALIMVSEPAWATLFAVWVLHESVTGQLFFGGVTILLAMALSALGYRRRIVGAVG